MTGTEVTGGILIGPVVPGPTGVVKGGRVIPGGLVGVATGGRVPTGGLAGVVGRVPVGGLVGVVGRVPIGGLAGVVGRVAAGGLAGVVGRVAAGGLAGVVGRAVVGGLGGAFGAAGREARGAGLAGPRNFGVFAINDLLILRSSALRMYIVSHAGQKRSIKHPGGHCLQNVH